MQRFTEKFEREAAEFAEWQKRNGGIVGDPPPFIPSTERMPDPCECCGKIHAPKRKTLGERLHASNF